MRKDSNGSTVSDVVNLNEVTKDKKKRRRHNHGRNVAYLRDETHNPGLRVPKSTNGFRGSK